MTGFHHPRSFWYVAIIRTKSELTAPFCFFFYAKDKKSQKLRAKRNGHFGKYYFETEDILGKGHSEPELNLSNVIQTSKRVVLLQCISWNIEPLGTLVVEISQTRN